MNHIAHLTEDGRVQALEEHLNEVSRLAAEYAGKFKMDELAACIGYAHDVGKYSHAFQKRITQNGLPTDHSTAGGRFLWDANQNVFGAIAACCVMGHHAGLPNGGARSDPPGESTLRSRLKKETAGEIYEPLNGVDFKLPPPRGFAPGASVGMGVSLMAHMLFSCLVDADFIDTERFMNDEPIERGGHSSMVELNRRLNEYISRFDPASSDINGKRAEVQEDCRNAASDERGVFTLTVPTGGGKTISSLCFAVKHAIRHGMDRIIYVIPYVSIIEQTVETLSAIFGSENVLAHYSTAEYDNNEKDKKYLATENWDIPVVVTTNVQFFESLFAKRTSACRKLHNIANSVIVLDEAQVLPASFLTPCVQAIAELVKNYGCTAVLSTATQSALDKFIPAGIYQKEICRAPEELYEFFQRVEYKNIGSQSNEELAGMLMEHRQALCIVNTKRRAADLFQGIGDEDGNFYLTTNLYPIQRRVLLGKIRERLKSGEVCRVIATSLIEAGVDVDFPAVYREQAGIDSIIQAAGRCNREGKRKRDESIVHVFDHDDEYRRMAHANQTADVAREVMRSHKDISSLKAIRAYFETLFYIKGDQALDCKDIIGRLDRGSANQCSIPFEDIAADFKLIEDSGVNVFIPDGGDAEKLLEQYRYGYINKALMRKMGGYCVNVYRRKAREYLEIGVIQQLDEGLFVLSDRSAYSEKTGLASEIETGRAIFG